MESIIVSIPVEKSPLEQKEAALPASCKYYKGEEVCPYLREGEAPSYGPEYALENILAFWWYAEREVVRAGWDTVRHGIECYVYKHLEGRPATEEELMASYDDGKPLHLPDEKGPQRRKNENTQTNREKQ